LKVQGLSCVVCGRTPVDPAHIVPQWRGGCRHPDCVIPLCRTHHRLYDRCGFRLLLWIGLDLEVELIHALLHATAEELVQGLDGDWGPRPDPD
jgi:HNH endonuclease